MKEYHQFYSLEILDGLQTLEMLEKKEKVLQKKIAMEVEKAKEFTRLKNKKGKQILMPSPLAEVSFIFHSWR